MTRKSRQNNYDNISYDESGSSSFCNSSLNSTYPSSLQSTVVGSYFFICEDDNAGSSSNRMFPDDKILDKVLDTKSLNDTQSNGLNGDIVNDESNGSNDASDGWRNRIKENSFQNILAILLNHSKEILNKRILIRTFAFYLNNSKWWIFPAFILFLSYCYICQFSFSNNQCAFWIIKTTDLDSQYRNFIVINDDGHHHHNHEVGFEYSDSLVRAAVEEQVKNICAAEVEKRIKPSLPQQANHEVTTYQRYIVDDVIANLIRNEIHKTVEEKLHDYSQDKLNRADYALLSGGAKIISVLTSPTYETWPTKWSQQIIASVTGHGITRGRPPTTAIQPEMHVGQCWPFSGEKGQLAILLSRKIFVTAVTYEHVTKKLAMDVTSAPKEFEVWGFVYDIDDNNNNQQGKVGDQQGDDDYGKEKEKQEQGQNDELLFKKNDQYNQESGEFVLNNHNNHDDKYEPKNSLNDLDDSDNNNNSGYISVGGSDLKLGSSPNHLFLGNFVYKIDGPSIQTFEVNNLGVPIRAIVMKIKSNWNNYDYTCLYRFRVHGAQPKHQPFYVHV
nr:14940_t:CDS:2 [Entrophospora candida]